MWEADNKQVQMGWLAPPLPIDRAGSVATYEEGSVNVAFRFGVGPAGDFRARDDVKRDDVNLYCAVWAPIRLPTWGRIAEMPLGARPTKRNREFFKADH